MFKVTEPNEQVATTLCVFNELIYRIRLYFVCDLVHSKSDFKCNKFFQLNEITLIYSLSALKIMDSNYLWTGNHFVKKKTTKHTEKG